MHIAATWDLQDFMKSFFGSVSSDMLKYMDVVEKPEKRGSSPRGSGSGDKPTKKSKKTQETEADMAALVCHVQCLTFCSRLAKKKECVCVLWGS